MRKLLIFLEQASQHFIISLAILITALIGMADYYIGPDLSTTLFYFLPIAIAAWYSSVSVGAALACLAAFTWLITDIGAGREYTYLTIFVWNTAVRLGIFLFVSLLISNLKRLLHQEELTSETDYLTGILNSRGFTEKFAQEYERSARLQKVFSMAYIDIDDFKKINDKLGHATGDKLLTMVVDALSKSLRKIDILGRMGGDEFVILFPETNSDGVKHAYLHAHTQLMEIIKQNDWPISFSIGIVTFEDMPDSMQGALDVADQLMYSVKNSTKNSVMFKSWYRNVKKTED